MNISITNMKRVEGSPSLVRVNPKDKKKNFNFWTSVFSGSDSARLEMVLNISAADPEYDMNSFIAGIEYQGFDREFYIKHALTKMSVEVFSKFAIIGAIRGSNFKKITETCENMPQLILSEFTRLDIVKTPKKRTDLTILRNTACIPHWCAHWIQKSGIGKKILKNDCPAELQFPGAASLPMSKDMRMRHLRFCAEFSSLLPGGVFKVTIYATAASNLIPVSSIPVNILSVLGLKSDSEAYSLTEVDYAPFDNSKSLVKA
jgi:hypothetical protein